MLTYAPAGIGTEIDLAPFPKGILLVEDDASIRDVICNLLRQEGFVAEGARNGRDALDFLSRREAPSLILLDLQMPVMNGEELLQELEHDPLRNKIPVAILTATNRRVRSRLVVEQIGKPLNLDTLLGLAQKYAGANAPYPPLLAS